MKFFTVATYEDGYYSVLKQSAKRNKIKLDVLGWGEDYYGHKFKTDKTIEYLKKLDPNEIVLFLDGFDSMFLKNKDIIKKRFLKMKVKYIFSLDFRSTIDHNYMASFFSSNTKLCIYKGKNVVLNTGMFIGYAGELLSLFEKSNEYVNEQNKFSNQRVLQDMCRDGIEIPIDYNNYLFYNLDPTFISNDDVKIKNKEVRVFNKNLFGDKYATPCVISAPGNTSMDKLCKTLNFKHNPENNNRDMMKYIADQMKVHKNSPFFSYLEIIKFLSILYFLYLILIFVSNAKISRIDKKVNPIINFIR